MSSNCFVNLAGGGKQDQVGTSWVCKVAAWDEMVIPGVGGCIRHPSTYTPPFLYLKYMMELSS